MSKRQVQTAPASDTNQAAFFFDAPLPDNLPSMTRVPRPLAVPDEICPPVAKIRDQAQFEVLVASALEGMGDDISVDEVLDHIDLPVISRIGWHRSRVLAVLTAPNSGWQTYAATPIAHKTTDAPTKFRHRRLAPLMQCPGFDGEPCGHTTRGGALCADCIKKEEEDLWNQE